MVIGLTLVKTQINDERFWRVSLSKRYCNGKCKIDCRSFSQGESCPDQHRRIVYKKGRILEVSPCYNMARIPVWFVRHCRLDKNGRKYSSGDYYCVVRLLNRADENDMVPFASSEIQAMRYL